MSQIHIDFAADSAVKCKSRPGVWLVESSKKSSYCSRVYTLGAHFYFIIFKNLRVLPPINLLAVNLHFPSVWLCLFGGVCAECLSGLTTENFVVVFWLLLVYSLYYTKSMTHGVILFLPFFSLWVSERTSMSLISRRNFFFPAIFWVVFYILSPRSICIRSVS